MARAHEEAAELIWRHWQAGSVIDELPEALRPATRAEGYAVQACFERYSAKPRAGWKIAATSLAGQRHIGVDAPMAGRLLAERLYEIAERQSAGPSLEGNRMRVAEPEFAFRMGEALPPREGRYSVPEVLAAVDALHLAIELPDSRFAEFAKIGGPTLIADCACARDLVVGPAVAADWRSLDLAAHAVSILAEERAAHDGTGANVLGDPRIALAWLVNEVSGLGITLAAGELVTTGVCTVPLPVVPGDRVQADFGGLGRIAVTIAA